MFRLVVRGFLCQLVARFCFPTTTSTLTRFKPCGLFIHTGFVYKHGVSVNRAFSVLSLLDLLVFLYVYSMIVGSCLLVLYVLLVVCFGIHVYMSWCRGEAVEVGGAGGRSLDLMFCLPPPPTPSAKTQAPQQPDLEICLCLCVCLSLSLHIYIYIYV